MIASPWRPNRRILSHTPVRPLSNTLLAKACIKGTLFHIVLTERKRVRWLLIAGLLVVSFHLALVARVLLEREPRHQGKPLNYWFNQLPLTRIVSDGSIVTQDQVQLPGRRYGSFLETPRGAREAFQDIGTNALAFLLYKLKRSETRSHKPIQMLAIKYGFKRLPLPSIDAERQQAVTGLIFLSPLPPDYLPQVSALATNADPKVATAAKCVLRAQ